MESKQFVLRIDDTVFAVTKREYREYYRDMERWKYIKRMEKGKKLSYEQAVEDELPLERLSADDSTSLEDEVEQKIMIERMRDAIELLEEDEKRLIRQLFFNGTPLREISRKTGVPVMTLHYQQQKILKKLKKIMDF